MSCGFHSIVFAVGEENYLNPDEPLMVELQRLLQDLAWVYYQNYPSIQGDGTSDEEEQGAAARREPIRRQDLEENEEMIKKFCPKLDWLFLYAAKLSGLIPKFGMKGTIFLDVVGLFSDYIRIPKMKLIESRYIEQSLQAIQDIHLVDAYWNPVQNYEAVIHKLEHYRVPDPELPVTIAPHVTLMASSHGGHMRMGERKA